MFRKKEVPEELPDLATESIEKENAIITNFLKQEEKATPKAEPVKIDMKTEEKKNGDKGFILQLQKDINNEITDLDKLERWYKNKFIHEDIVTGMKSYWDKKENTPIFQKAGSKFKVMLEEKTEKLGKLEKEWQEQYFALMEKEEEIRAEEQELKSILADIVKICKEHKKRKE